MKFKQIRDKYPKIILILGMLLYPIWFPLFCIILLIGFSIELIYKTTNSIIFGKDEDTGGLY